MVVLMADCKRQTRRDEIFLILVDFASAHKGNSPSGRELWRQVMRVRGRSMAYGVFQRHVEKLMTEGRIQRVDGEIVIPDSDWIPPG